MSDPYSRPSKRRKTSSPDTGRTTRHSGRSLSNPKSKDSSLVNGGSAHKPQSNGTGASATPSRSLRNKLSDSKTASSNSKTTALRHKYASASPEPQPTASTGNRSTRRLSKKSHLQVERQPQVQTNGHDYQESPDQKKPNWRGWVKLKEGEQVQNDFDEWDRIKREAEEAAKNGSPSKQERKSRRTRASDGMETATAAAPKPTNLGRSKSESQRQASPETTSTKEQDTGRRKSSGTTRATNSSKTDSLASPQSDGILKRKRSSLLESSTAEQGRKRTPVKDKGNVSIEDLLDFDRVARESPIGHRMDVDGRAASDAGLTIPDSQDVRPAPMPNRSPFAYDQPWRPQYGLPRPRFSHSPAPRLPAHRSISPTPEEEEEENLDENAKRLRQLLTGNSPLLDVIKDQILNGLTTKNRLDDHPEYEKVHQLLSQTVLAGEGNSMVIVGSRGTGKSAMVETAISSLEQDNKDDFHVVRLNGFIHTDDKIALKEIWRQLGREMDVDEELMSGRSNYADILTSLLALLSHHAAPGDGSLSDAHAVSKSIIFILDEFHLFASHLRQTLLYNLFDLAQSSRTPLAVIGLTTRTDVVDLLEKRVKSRFGQRIVLLTPPRSFETYKQICQHTLHFRATDSKFSDRLFRLARPDSLLEIADAWNTNVSTIFAHPRFLKHLERIYAVSRVPITFFNTALVPVASLTAEKPLLTIDSLTQPVSALQPPESELEALLPSLSTVQLSLLIAAARLEIVLAPANPAATAPPPGATFDVVYQEYVDLASKSRVSASAAGQLGVGGAGAKVWGRKVAKKEWEGLAGRSAVIPIGLGGTRGLADQKWVVEVGGLEEIRNWLENQPGRDVEKGLVRWCKI